MQGNAQPAGQAGQPVDAEHFNRLQHDTSTASNLLSHFDDWEAIVQQAGQASGSGGREAVNASSGATVVNADVIREAVQDFLQRQAPASSTQTMMNGSALVSPIHQRCCSVVSVAISAVWPLPKARGVVVASCQAFCLKQVLCTNVKDRRAGAGTFSGPGASFEALSFLCIQLHCCAAGGVTRD